MSCLRSAWTALCPSASSLKMHETGYAHQALAQPGHHVGPHKLSPCPSAPPWSHISLVLLPAPNRSSKFLSTTSLVDTCRPSLQRDTCLCALSFGKSYCFSCLLSWRCLIDANNHLQSRAVIRHRSVCAGCG